MRFQRPGNCNSESRCGPVLYSLRPGHRAGSNVRAPSGLGSHSRPEFCGRDWLDCVRAQLRRAGWCRRLSTDRGHPLQPLMSCRIRGLQPISETVETHRTLTAAAARRLISTALQALGGVNRAQNPWISCSQPPFGKSGVRWTRKRDSWLRWSPAPRSAVAQEQDMNQTRRKHGAAFKILWVSG